MEDNDNSKVKKRAAAKFLKLFYRLNSGFVALMCIILSGIMFVQILLRYVFKGDLHGMEEYIFFFYVWMVFVGAGVAVFDNTHLRSDTLIVLIKNKRFLNKMLLVADFFEVILYVAFLYFSYRYILDCIALPMKTRVMKFPMLVGQSAVMYGAFLIALFGVTVYVRQTRARIKAFKAYRSGKLGKYETLDDLNKEEVEA